jgi:hypothetical protein
MTGNRSIVRLTAAMFAVVHAGLATPSEATTLANCDWYAKTALKQQQENELKKCGFTGPNWTSDLKGHLGWCNANPDQFRAEAQRRDQQLMQCNK